MTQAQLAEKSGLQPSAISHFESARRSPSFDNLRILADTLSVTTDHLLGRDQEPGVAGPLVERIFRRAGQITHHDLEILAEFADALAKRTRADGSHGS
jgi:transcriptional regulator with XRE-family HTH domain